MNRRSFLQLLGLTGAAAFVAPLLPAAEKKPEPPDYNWHGKWMGGTQGIMTGKDKNRPHPSQTNIYVSNDTCQFYVSDGNKWILMK